MLWNWTWTSKIVGWVKLYIMCWESIWPVHLLQPHQKGTVWMKYQVWHWSQLINNKQGDQPFLPLCRQERMDFSFRCGNAILVLEEGCPFCLVTSEKKWYNFGYPDLLILSSVWWIPVLLEKGLILTCYFLHPFRFIIKEKGKKKSNKRIKTHSQQNHVISTAFAPTTTP